MLDIDHDSNPAAELVDHYIEPIRDFLEDEATQDVAVNDPGFVWVRQRGTWIQHKVPRLDLFWLENLAHAAGSLRRQNVGTEDPILDTEIVEGQYRYNVVLFPNVGLGKIANTIRRHEAEVAPIEAMPDRYDTQGWNQLQLGRVEPVRQHLLELYQQEGSPAQIVTFLKACVRARQTILIIGPTGAGKTTLLNTLAREIPPHKRIVTLEDSKEIKLPLHPNSVQLLFARGAGGKDRINPEQLANTILRMHPDIAIMGELRGNEAWVFVNDIIPPHPGSLVTTHGNSADSGFMRVFGLCRGNRATAAMNDQTLMRMIANVIDVIAPLYEDEDTKRFKFRPIWYVGEAMMNRGKNATELFWET